MKKYFFCALVLMAMLQGIAQVPSSNNNTLLWRISGNGLTQPSYLFGTIHMICDPDIKISDSLRDAIKQAEYVYLELDMDNISELMSVMNKLKMNGDTTLADLLEAEEYAKVKAFFQDRQTMIPFAMLEKYKPMLAAASIMQMSFSCEQPLAMEQLIMQEAKLRGKEIKGLETMEFQMSIFDSIPYRMQAKQLYTYIDNYGKEAQNAEFTELARAYRNQEINKLADLTSRNNSDMKNFSEILLYKRNKNWVHKLEEAMPGNSILIAVGAGHLPGEKGVISLLKKAGYKVEPVKNEMVIKHEKQL